MVQDHFISQTYLERFGDSVHGGMLNAYSKLSGKKFRCWPKDICREWDGDLNQNWFPQDPGLLGEFRKLSEPGWNISVKAISTASIDVSSKLQISCMFVNLMTCTPAWVRIGVEMHNWHSKIKLSEEKKRLIENGSDDKFLIDSMEAVEQGEIDLVIDPAYVKAISTKQAMAHVWYTYNQNWIILANDSDEPFVTSDSPVTIEERKGNVMRRYLPISPTRCLLVLFMTNEIPPLNFNQRPLGRILYRSVRKPVVERINHLVAQCAEDLVVSSVDSEGIKRLVQKWAKFGMELKNEVFTIRGETKGQLLMSTVRVCARRGN